MVSMDKNKAGKSQNTPSQDSTTHIAQTIKEFEKGLHAIFPHSPSGLISFVPLASSGLSISPLGPNDLVKRPHLKAHSGRTRTSKRPFCKAIWAGRPPTAGMESPLQGIWGAVGGIETKKGKCSCASLAHAKILNLQLKCKCGMKEFDINRQQARTAVSAG